MKSLRVEMSAKMLSIAMSMTFVIASVCVMSGRAGAQEELPDHDLSEWSVGETVSGAGVDLKKAEGKVVAIEYWGTR